MSSPSPSCICSSFGSSTYRTGACFHRGCRGASQAGAATPTCPTSLVVDPGTVRVEAWHLAPPPLLVVEIASPSTRAVDRSRKLADYRLGGAQVYLLIDLPGLTGVERPEADLHSFVSPAESGAKLTGLVGVALGDQHATLDLDALISRST